MDSEAELTVANLTRGSRFSTGRFPQAMHIGLSGHALIMEHAPGALVTFDLFNPARHQSDLQFAFADITKSIWKGFTF